MILLATKADMDDVVRIFSHPDVLPYIEFDEPTWMLPRRVEETWDRFAYFLEPTRRGFFQIEAAGEAEPDAVVAHVAAYPEIRGRALLSAWREVVVLLQGASVERVYAWVPRKNDRAWMFALLCGLIPCEEPCGNPRPDHYTSEDGYWLYVSLKEHKWAVR